MKKSILIILVVLFAATVFSQNNFVFVQNNKQGKGISVRWIAEQIIYKEGVKIYRKQSGQSWTLLTTVNGPTSLAPHPSFVEKHGNLFYSYQNMTANEFKESFDGIFTIIESIDNYAFAKAINIAYDDETAITGNLYQYKIEGIVNGKEKELGITSEILCGEYAPLEAPSDIDIKREKKVTKIAWNNEIDKYYAYNVFFKNEKDENWKSVGENLSSSGLADINTGYFLALPTDKDSTYLFKIEAKDYFGEKTKTSKEYIIKTVDLDAPLAPSITITPHSSKMTSTITWNLPVDDDVLGYNILKSLEDEDSLYKPINNILIPVGDTLYVDQLSESGIYYYKIEIMDGSGNKSLSYPQFAEIYDVIPPPVPQNLSATSDTGKLILKWDNVKAKDLKGYVLYRSVADDNNEDNLYVPVASKIIETNYYEEKMAKNIRNPFVYIVKSIDTLLNESEQSNIAVIQLPDVTPPVAPFIKETVEEIEGLAIKWMPNVENDLKGYNLYKRLKGDTSDFEQLNMSMIPKSINVYIDKEATRGVFYEYRLVAVDNSGLTSKTSNTILGKINNLELAGKVIIAKNKLNSNKKEFILEWSTDSLINEPIIGTSVYRSYKDALPLPITKVSNENKLKDKLDKPGSYTYHIRAYGERGNVIKSETIEIELDIN